DVTIAGHPSDYLPGFSVSRTLEGHGVLVDEGDGEDVDALYRRMCKAVTTPGPVALVNRRKMAIGVAGAEGSSHAHDALRKDVGVAHLRSGGRVAAAEYLEQSTAISAKQELKGSRGSTASRTLFGKILNEILEPMSAEERRSTVRVFDNDLE